MMTTTQTDTDRVSAFWQDLEARVGKAREQTIYFAPGIDDPAPIQQALRDLNIWGTWNEWAPWIRDTKLSHDLYHAIYEQTAEEMGEQMWWVDGMVASLETIVETFRSGVTWAWEHPREEQEAA